MGCSWVPLVTSVSMAIALLACAPPAWAQGPVAPRPQIPVGELGSDLALDGRLDEAFWAAATPIDRLTMIEPLEGAQPTLATIIRVAAGPREIVIGIECLDDDPSRIVSYSKARDSQLRREDHVKIVLDTFLDGRSGYVFAVNPSGARYDALVSDRGERENSNWDEVWEAATHIGDAGWSAEIRIPVRSIRFAAGLDRWGFNVERRVERLQEQTRWAGTSRSYTVTQTSRSGLITGLPAMDSGVGLSIRPSVVGRAGKPSEDLEATLEGDPSLDVTQLIGSGVIGSLTVNTDFAETEVDSRRTNLTRFPLFFPEKRTFFLEGSDIFDFGLGTDRDVLAFFSRRIGLVDGEEVPLQLGGKVNGRLGNTNFGALITRTGDTEGVAPATTMGVVRVQQNVLRESSIGLIGTAGDPLGRAGAWTAGVDATYQTSRFGGDSNFLIGVWGLLTDREDLGNGRSAYGFKIDYPNDPLDVALIYRRVGENFDPSLGFVPRKAVQVIEPRLTYTARPDWGWLRNMAFELFTEIAMDLDGHVESYRIFTAPVNLRLESGDRVEFNVVPTGDRLVEPFEISDGVVIAPGTYDWMRYRIEFSAAAKRPVSGQASWWFGTFYDGSLDQIQVRVNWNPSATFNLELSGERNVASLPAGSFTRDLLGTRLGLNFSPDLVLSSYVQWDNDSESLGTNTRLRWTFSPLGELFVIYNTNVYDPFDRWRTDTNQISVKLRYTWRL
jgi:hypothetical protein